MINAVKVFASVSLNKKVNNSKQILFNIKRSWFNAIAAVNKKLNLALILQHKNEIYFIFETESF